MTENVIKVGVCHYPRLRVEYHPGTAPLPVDNMGLLRGAFLRLLPSPLEPQTDLSPRQVYSLTRVATLLAVILNLIGLDATTQINCQVGAQSWFHLYTILTVCNSKAWATFNFVSNSSAPVPEERPDLYVIVLDLCLSGSFFLFTISCVSRVSHLLCF